MADENTPDEVETTNQEPESTPDFSAELEKWKAIARKNEARAKDNADKAKRFDELEEANKTELQKLRDQLAAAQKAQSDAEMGRLRASIAAKHQVPESLLTGTDAESFEASAQSLIEFRGAAPKAPSPAGQGNVGQPIGEHKSKQLTEADLQSMTTKQINDARKSGQLDTLLGHTP